MATGDLKGDIVNKAYSHMRVSGITKQPGAEEISLGIHTLESMAAQWFGNNICAGYNFEDEPNVNSKHNVDRTHWLAFSLSLANILLIDKGKTLTPELAAKQRGSYSSLVTLSAADNQRGVQYPSRMPMGSGNTLQYTPYNKFYRPGTEAPISCSTNKMVVDQVDDYVEYFDSYLKEVEDIASYTIEADTGLTIVSDSNTINDVLYRIKAVSNSETQNGYLRVKIVVTTTDGRVEPRYIDFQVSSE